ncbi:MAG: DUF938 domain-containing protein [Pseudohongiellaceae bacterium]
MPFSQACENNKLPILEVLKRHLETGLNRHTLLEIASGTGQHAAFFAAALPFLTWQATETSDNLEILRPRIADAELPNLPTPQALDVNGQWPMGIVDAVFSANSLHIISTRSVENFFMGVGLQLRAGGLLFVYGPFKYDEQFTSESNDRFDDWLKERDPASGIRDFEWVNDLATKAGLDLLEDNPMPANNQLLVWKSRSGSVVN